MAKKKAASTNTLTVQQTGDSVVAKMPQQDFRALFYLLTGKPDSKTKLFTRPVIVSPDDISDLNQRIVDKLNNHHITKTVTTVTVQFSGKSAIEFGSWPEFSQFNWKIPEKTEAVSVKWDFMIDLPDFEVPQRHTLVMRLTTPATPQQFFQLMFASDTDELDDLSPHLATCFCRVDFINHRLGSELITLIDEWNDALRKHASAKNWFDKLEKYDSLIAKLVRYVPCAALAVLSGFVLYHITKDIPTDAPLTIEGMRTGFYWLLGTGLVIFTMSQIGKMLGSQAYHSLGSYGSRPVFEFTRGDDNQATESKTKNKKCIKRFLFVTAGSILLSVIKAFACWWIIPK